MLKYGEIQYVQSGYSKNVTPRNLTYRTANTTISLAAQSANATLSLTGGGTGGGGNSDNITATTGDFVNLNANTLNADIIKKKTSTNSQILINDNLGISDVTIGKPTYNFKFNKDANLFSNSINFDSPIITFRDNVIALNNQAKSSLTYTFQENLLYNSALSGFVFPNINEKDGNLVGTNQILNNSLLILPANHFFNYNLTQKNLGFTKYSGNYHFGNDEIGNNVRFVKTNYKFNNDSTFNKETLSFGKDNALNTINSLNNLLNLEAKNIALGNGDIVLLNGVSFNPTDISNTPQGKSFNFKFNDRDSSNNLSVFKIEKEKATFNVPEVELNDNITFNNYDNANPKLLYKNSNDFLISRKNEDTTVADLDYIKFHKNVDGTGKITFLQPVAITGGSQGVSLLGPVLDFSGNGEAFFTDNLNFNSNSIPIVTFNKDFVNIQPDLHFTGTNEFQNIKFYPNELVIIDVSDNKFLSFNSTSNYVKIHKILDLSSNGAIQFGSALNFKSRNSIPFTIKTNSIDISCNTLNFKQLAGSFIKFASTFTITDTGTNANTNKYLGFDSILKNITLFKPINFSGDGVITFQNSVSFNTFSGNKLFTVYQDSLLNSFFDTSANLQFLNKKSVIRFPDNGTLDFQDVFGFSYFTMNSVTQTIDFKNPLRLTGTGEIDIDKALNIVNSQGVNIASFNESQLQLHGNLVFETTGYIKVSQGNLKFKDGNNSDFLSFDVDAQRTILYKPLQLDLSGQIYFTNIVQFISTTDLSNSIVLINQDGVVISNIVNNGNLIFDGSSNAHDINFRSNLLNITDISNNIYMQFNSVSRSISINYPLYIPSVVQLQAIQFYPDLTIFDANNNRFLYLDTSNQSVHIDKLIDLRENGKIQFGNKNITFTDGSDNVIIISKQSIDISTNINFKNSNSKIVFKDSIIINDGDSNIVTLTNESIDTSANIQLIKDNPTIKFRAGELKLVDLSNNYVGFNATTKRITTYQVIDVSNNINFKKANSLITFNNSLIINDGDTNIVTLTQESIDTSANINFNKSNSKIVFKDSIIINDGSSNILTLSNGLIDISANINFKKPNATIIFKDSISINDGDTNIVTLTSDSIDTSANIQLIKDNPIIKFRTGELKLIDLSDNYVGFNANTKRITIYQIIDVSNNINFKKANSTITFNNSININDGDTNIVTLTTESIDTSANIQLIKDNPIIKFRTGELKLVDLSDNYVGFNATTKRITTYQIIDVSNNINFKKANSTITFNNSININDGDTNIVTLTSDSIDTSANIQLIKDNPIIKFRTGELKLVDLSDNYVGFNANTKRITTYQIIDVSNNINFKKANSLITFNNSLIINDGDSNIVTLTTDSIDTSANINFNKSNSKIVFKDSIIINDGTENIIQLSNGLIDISANINFKKSNSKIVFKESIIINDGDTNIVTLTQDSIDTSANIQLIKDNPIIKFRTGELKLVDLSNNYVGFNATTKRITTYQIVDVSNNINFKKADSTVTFNNSINVSDGDSNIVTLTTDSIDTSANIQLIKDNPIIKFRTGELKINDLTSNYIGFNATTKTINMYKELDLSANLVFSNNNQSIIINNGSLFIKDNTNNPFLSFDTNTMLVNISQPLILTQSNPKIRFSDLNNSDFSFTNTTSTNYLQCGFTNVGNVATRMVTINQLLTLQNNLAFSNNILYIKDSDGTNYMSFNKLTKKIKFLQTLDSSGGIPQPSYISSITFNAPVVFTINDNLGHNFFQLDPTLNTISLGTDTNIAGYLTFDNINPKIQITSGELVVADLSNNKYIGFDSTNQIIKTYKPIDLSGYVWKGTFYSSDKYNLNDLVIYDDLQVYICTEQPLSQRIFNTDNGYNAGGGFQTQFPSSTQILLMMQENLPQDGDKITGPFIQNGTFITFVEQTSQPSNPDNSAIIVNLNLPLINPVGAQGVVYTYSINPTPVQVTTSNFSTYFSLLAGIGPGLVFKRDSFIFSDKSNNNYLGFDKTNLIVKIYQPLDLTTNGTINFGTALNFNNNGTQYLGIDSANTNVKVYQPLDVNELTFSNTELLIKDAQGNKYLGFDSTNKMIHFYQTTDLSGGGGIGDASGIQFTLDTFTFSDTSNNNYIVLDKTTQKVNITKPLDISSNGNILFNEQINFKSNGNNILSIENNANYPQIGYTEKLTLQNTVTNEMYTNAVLRYNIFAENINSFEKKYLAKTSILNGSGLVQYYFRNIIEHKDEQITFRGKVVSRDLSNNSASFTFDGYTNYLSPQNANNLEFELNTLHSPSGNWTIKSFYIYSTDLVMELQSNQSTTTNWVVSIESISV